MSKPSERPPVERLAVAVEWQKAHLDSIRAHLSNISQNAHSFVTILATIAILGGVGFIVLLWTLITIAARLGEIAEHLSKIAAQ